jgi:hypothetical protein
LLTARRTGRCFAFDYDHSGLLDHVVFYDQGGYLMVYGHVGNIRLQLRPLVWGEGREWELSGAASAADQVFGFDYTSSGKPDHLVFYRPGEGRISVFRNNYGALERVFGSNKGFAEFDLKNAADRAFAFDFGSTGKLDHLVFYRPGDGRISIFRNNAGTLEPVWKSTQGLPAFDLKNAADRGFAFDFGGTGKLDHMVFYRPGAGKIIIAKRDTVNNATTFTPVYDSEKSGNKGIGGYDLASAADQAMAFDCDGVGHQDYLLFYRPNRGAIYIFKKNDKGTFDPPVYRRQEGDNPGKGIANYDLLNPADRIIAVDYNGTGTLDHLMLSRAGVGGYNIVRKTGKLDSNEFVRVV